MVELRSALALGTASTAIFASTCLSGLWLAYDAPAARREFAFLCAGLALAMWLGARARRHFRTTQIQTGFLAGVGSVVVAVGAAVGLTDAGAAAGGLSILVPMAACGLSPARGRLRAVRIAFTALAMGVGTAALLATFEGSAIGGLIVGALVGAWLGWRADRAGPDRWAKTVDAAGVAALVLGVALYLSAMFWTDPPLIPDRAMSVHLVTRRDLWQEALTMVGDYPLTGTGLAGSAMVMSSYVWLRHVPFHPQVHNLFLQVALQQGIPGLVGLAGMFVASGWIVITVARSTDRRVRRLQSFGAATGAVLATLACAGLFESDLFGSCLLACLPLPFGLALGLGLAALKAKPRGGADAWHLPVVAGLAPLAVIVTIALWPGARARWQTNRGAVLQTQAELRVYRWPEWSIQDQLRRGQVVDLEPAIRHYEAALAVAPRNATAHRRLGQIDLSRGRTEEALRHLKSATETAPGDRAARRLLAEAYAITGKRAEAISLWKTTRSSREELDPRVWWYQHVGARMHASRLQDAIRELVRMQSATLPP